MIQSTLINLYPNEYNQEFQCFPFLVELDRCLGSWNTLNDFANKNMCPKDLNLSVFNMIAGRNKSKTLTKHISYKCKYNFDGRKYNPNQWWNNNKC